jgi:fermentation-respiration switch protein FrsA (DUF1100 family)
VRSIPLLLLLVGIAASPSNAQSANLRISSEPSLARLRISTRPSASTDLQQHLAEVHAHDQSKGHFILIGAVVGGIAGGALALNHLRHCEDCYFGGPLVGISVGLGAGLGALTGYAIQTPAKSVPELQHAPTPAAPQRLR